MSEQCGWSELREWKKVNESEQENWRDRENCYTPDKQLYWNDNSSNEEDRHANIYMNYK